MAVSASAQNVNAPKYGVDSVASVTNQSTYREYFKQWEAAKYAKDAISMEMVSAWRYVFLNSPRLSQYVYTNGEKSWIISSVQTQARRMLTSTH